MRKILGVLFCGVISYSSAFAAPGRVSNKINVLTSFTILADITKNIGGEYVNVSYLVGPNQDPHEFELRPSDMIKIKKSQVFVINGLGLEGWIGRLVESDQYKGVVVVASDGVKALSLTEDGKVVDDPHAWNDPIMVEQKYIPNITSGLCDADPKHCSEYKENANIYASKVHSQYNTALLKFEKLGESNIQAITTHDAFGYFAKRFNLKFLFAQGVSTDSEASAKDIVQLERLIRQSRVKVVFLENMTNNKLIKQIAKDTGAKIGGQLYSDALSPVNGPAPTYLKLLDSNVNIIINAYK